MHTSGETNMAFNNISWLSECPKITNGKYANSNYAYVSRVKFCSIICK